jgi:hypothetical protein
VLDPLSQPLEDQGRVGLEVIDGFGREPALVLVLEGLREVPEIRNVFFKVESRFFFSSNEGQNAKKGKRETEKRPRFLFLSFSLVSSTYKTHQ